MKILHLVFTLLVITSCSDEKKTDNSITKSNQNAENLVQEDKNPTSSNEANNPSQQDGHKELETPSQENLENQKNTPPLTNGAENLNSKSDDPIKYNENATSQATQDINNQAQALQASDSTKPAEGDSPAAVAPKLEASQMPSEYNVDKINDSDIVFGNRNAQVVLIEYSSPTCPHCAYYHQNFFPKLKAKYIDTNKIAYVFRFFIFNKQDLDAASLVMCDVNKITPFIDTIYSRQQAWAYQQNYQDILFNIAQLGGISHEQYNKCLSDSNIRDMLILQSKKIHEKFASKLAATPAFILNGQLLTQSHSFKAISDEIDKHLQ